MALDLALRLWRQGYDAIPSARGWPVGRDAFVTRLLGRPALVVRGPERARLFYDTDRVRRKKAAPAALAALLFGRGAVHGLDGREHAERKALMMRVLDPARVDELVRRAGADLDAAASAWSGRELARIVDGFGGAGAAYPRAWLARCRSDRVLRAVLADAREGRASPPEGSAVRLLADAVSPALRRGRAGPAAGVAGRSGSRPDRPPAGLGDGHRAPVVGAALAHPRRGPRAARR